MTVATSPPCYNFTYMVENEGLSGPSPSRSSWAAAPLPRVIMAQIGGAIVAFGAGLGTFYALGLSIPYIAILIVQGMIAAWIGHKLVLPKWWIPVQIILPPAALLVGTFEVPAWIFLAVFLVLLLVYWNSARGRVPLYLTNRETWHALASIIESRQATHFVDLGCGIGGALLYLAKTHPNTEFTGVESAPLPFLLAWIRARLSGLDNLSIRYGSLWKQPLADYDFVYVFLSPAPMPELYEKVNREMQPNSVFVSNSFTVPGFDAEQIIQVNDKRETQLYLWTC